MATYRVKSGGSEHVVTVVDEATGGASVAVDGREFHVDLLADSEVAASARARHSALATRSRAALVEASADEGRIHAPIPGKIIAIAVSVGDIVAVDQVVMKLEAMKMENEIISPVSGIVKEIAVSEGAEAASGQLLISIG
jgi:biotin carboxyl carrier protein